MGLLNWLISGSELAKPIEAVSNLYTTDKARIEAESELQKQLNNSIAEQSKVNAILAASQKLFNSGWQPLIGWTCGFLVLIYYFPQIVIATLIWSHHCFETGIVSPFPIKPDDILNLIYLLFGFGLHSVFKPNTNINS
jgi:hypothetical protein